MCMRRMTLIIVLVVALTVGCVGSDNIPPTIEYSSPASQSLSTTPYSSLEFSISASDPEDEVTYRWYVNDDLEGSNASFSHQFVDEGSYTVRGIADDGIDSVATVWDVEVTIDDDALRATIASLRSLEFTSEVPFEEITREELIEDVNEDFEQRADEIRLTQRILYAFNVWEGDDLLSTLKSFYAGEAWGYYNSAEDTYYYVADADKPPIVKMVTMAHELTHALQDMHYGIPSLYAGADDDDEVLAIESLIEGDATYIEERYIESLGIEERAALYRYYASQELPDYDPFVASLVLYPYSHGQRFVASLVTGEGMGYLADVYTDPPETTEQILHPETYRSGEGPMDVDIVYDTPLEKLDENTLGEGMLRLFLDQHVTREQARNAAAGWGGDAYAYYASEDDYMLVYVSRWDTEEDAVEFFNTYVMAIEAWGDDYREIDRDGTLLHAANDGRLVKMERSSTTVTLIIRPEPDGQQSGGS